MYLSTHAAVGVLISQNVDKPLWVFLLSFLSHFILDFVPHGDEKAGDWALRRPKNAIIMGSLDVGILTILIALLYATNDLPDMALISAGIIGAILPDFLSNIFPIIHRFTSWLMIIRLIHRLQYWLRLMPIWKGHNWFHKLSHNTFKWRLSVKQGLVLQLVVFLVSLTLALGYR